MRKFVLILLSVFYSFSSQSQPATGSADVIKEANDLLKSNPSKAIALAKTVLNDKKTIPGIFVKSTIIIGIGFKKTGQYDSSLFYVNMGLKKALEVNDTSGIIKLYSNKGVLNYLKADYLSAASNFKQAGHYYKVLGDLNKSDTTKHLNYAKVLNNIGSSYIKTGRQDSALTYFINSLSIREEYRAPEKMITVSKLNIGSIYLAMGDNESSKKWINDALNMATKANNKALMEKCYINLGIVYKNTGDTLKAIKSYKNSLKLCNETGNTRDKSIALQNLAQLLSNQKKYDEAYYYFTEALKHNNTIHANNSNLQLAIGRMLMEQTRYSQAIVHANEALKMADESGNIEVQVAACRLLSEAYKHNRDYKQALFFNEQYIVLKDSVTSRENRQYVQELKERFETEQKVNEIELLKKLNQSEHVEALAIQSRQQLIIVIVFLAFALIVAIALYYFSKKKKQRQLYLVEKKLLQVDLHNKDLESKKLQAEVNFKTKQLTTHALNMVQKNQILTDIREKLQILSKRANNELMMDFKSIIKDINHMQRTEKEWELFKKHYESINKEFYNKLRVLNPALSVSDFRLAALISLNLNIKETATVLNITPDSVKLARHRLRKKLGLHTNDDLYLFLSKL